MFAIQKLRAPIVGAIAVLLLSLISPVLVSAAKLELPTSPTNLHVASSTLVSCSSSCTMSFVLQWNASPTAQQVTSYKVIRNGVQEGTATASASPSFTSTGTVGTSYSYTVQAVNSRGTGPNSNTVTFTLQLPLAVPTAPTNVVFASSTQPFQKCQQVPCTIPYAVEWDASPPAQQVSSYKVFNNDVLLGTVLATAPRHFESRGLLADTLNIVVQAVNSAGTSPNSAVLTGNFYSYDYPVNLAATSVATNSIGLQWSYSPISRDHAPVDDYIIRCQVLAGQPCANRVQFVIPSSTANTGSFVDTTVSPFTQYSYTIYTMDNLSIVSQPSNTITQRALGNATSIPTTPVISQDRITQPVCVTAPCPFIFTLTWNANPPSQQVTHYKIMRDGVLIGFVYTTDGLTSYSYSGSETAPAGTNHTYWIQAANNKGATPPSNAIVITTR